MSKLVYFFSLFLICISSCKEPGTDKGREGINAACDKFMQTFSEGRFSEAIQSLKQTSVISNSTIDTLDKDILKKVNNLLLDYGEILSYEFVTEGKVKNFIVKRYYVLKFKKYFLKFAFTLYNSGRGWAITNFSFDDELLEILR